jgi:3'(2'), 5'-bisphosphate nucleotidase
VTADLTAASLIEDMTRLVSKAAAEIMRIRATPLTPRLKDDCSPVTQADEASEAVLLDGLARLLPGIPVISEEAASQRVAASVPTFLLVDPLDGTREFIAGRDEFTINVAIIHDNRALTGILAAPAQAKAWQGAIGHGARGMSLPAGADPRSAVPRHIHARPFANPPVVLVSRSHPDPQTQALLSRWPRAQTKPCGSALKFALLAEGTADIYPRLSPTSEWDIAAGDAILTAAGGIVSDRNGQPISYNGGAASGFRVPAFIAWGDASAGQGQG